MREVLRPILELTVVIPGLLLAYFPVKSYLKQPAGRLAAWLMPMMLGLCVAGGALCRYLHASTALATAGLTLMAMLLYIRTTQISLWKSGTIALSVCAVFACLNSLSRALNAAMLMRAQTPQAAPWFCLRGGRRYNAVCWLVTAAAYYPATHAVRTMVEDDNFAQTWYVFWILPLMFIALNLFMVPIYPTTLYTGRVLQGYIVLSVALLILMFMFNTIFLLMATSLNRNARLRQEEPASIHAAAALRKPQGRHRGSAAARHDIRHHLNQISMLAEADDMEAIKAYLAQTFPDSRFGYAFLRKPRCGQRAGYYCALAKREGIPFSAQIDLPQTLPVDEIDMGLVLSNLLENALEASFRTAPARRQIKVKAYVHAEKLLLMLVENACDSSEVK